MKNANMPATPIVGSNGRVQPFTDDSGCSSMATGLTKREAFAMAAMQNILSRYNPYESGDFDSSDYDVTASHAVGLADALLKQLEVK